MAKRNATRKRKLSIQDIGYCKPGKTRNRKGSCLPASITRSTSCGPHDDHCVLDHSTLSSNEKETLRNQYLRPRYPTSWVQDNDEWLDNSQITSVMKQYEEAYPWFRFMGALPIDFSAPDPYLQDKTQKRCLHPDICSLDLRSVYEQGIRGIGMIFNLDPHYKGGSHWVGLYIDLHDIERPAVSFSDSYGFKPPRLIARFMRALRLQTPQATLGYNARRFQFSDTECGMYSMYFIICMIQGIPFKAFCKDSVPDRFMLALRAVLFSK